MTKATWSQFRKDVASLDKEGTSSMQDKAALWSLFKKTACRVGVESPTVADWLKGKSPTAYLKEAREQGLLNSCQAGSFAAPNGSAPVQLRSPKDEKPPSTMEKAFSPDKPSKEKESLLSPIATRESVSPINLISGSEKRASFRDVALIGHRLSIERSGTPKPGGPQSSSTSRKRPDGRGTV